jgi:hypothetical protein
MYPGASTAFRFFTASRMSEYQYYEFLAIDRPLDRAAQDALRSISSRAQISAASFTNHYEWGDFKGDPRKLMERWFDLHLYLANWGTRRLMIRLPKGILKPVDLKPFLGGIDWIEVSTAGGHSIVDIHHHEEGGYNGWDDGSGRLAALAPLRADLLSGDLRLFYLLWLVAVQEELVPDDVIEPMPGLGPLSGALESLADFFVIDPNLVQAAAELAASGASLSADSLRKAVADIPEREKAELLVRVADGDARVAAELRQKVRKLNPPPAAQRTAGMLRERAKEIEVARERAEAERIEAERRREAAAAKKAQRARLKVLKQRGVGSVWREIEQEIDRRNPAGYENAMGLLFDVQALAREEGDGDDFDRRLDAIRIRHEKKAKFIERLLKLGRGSGET